MGDKGMKTKWNKHQMLRHIVHPRIKITNGIYLLCGDIYLTDDPSIEYVDDFEKDDLCEACREAYSWKMLEVLT